MISTVSSTGPFANNETTSILTNMSSCDMFIFLITPMNSVELQMYLFLQKILLIYDKDRLLYLLQVLKNAVFYVFLVNRKICNQEILFFLYLLVNYSF